jgi:hypothetical protein
MWRGEFGDLFITKQRIDLQEDAKPMYQAPNGAGTNAREVEREEVDRRLYAGVIEP